MLQSIRMESRSTLRVSTESGGSWDDPSEDHLFMLLEDIERGNELFLIVEQLSDASGQTFIQTIRNEDGSYRVERRDGSPAEHYVTAAPDMRDAHALITSWAFGVAASADVEWTFLQLDA